MPSPRETTYIQNNFLIGERRASDSLSQETFSSCQELINYRTIKGGGVKRRPGIRLINEVPNIEPNQKVERFFSVGRGYLVLFHNVNIELAKRLVYIQGSFVSDVEIRPYHSNRYKITGSGVIPLEPVSVAYTMGDFAFHQVVDHITNFEHSRVEDMFEFGDRIVLLPARGLPFFAYIENNVLVVEPYFFDSSNLDSYDALIRAIPMNNEAQKFKDVLYDNTDVPSGRDDKVRLIIGSDSDLDRGRCRAWLGATKDYESSVEKIDTDKMALDDYIGVPIIFNVLPDDPVSIPLDFKNTINETDNSVQVTRERNWDEDASYPTGLLNNLNTETNVSDFSFDPTVDSSGSVRGTKATLIRELLYGRRYMVIPYRKVLSGNSGLADYSTVYPSSTTTVNPTTSVNADLEVINEGVETVTGSSFNEISVDSYTLSEEETAPVTNYTGDNFEARLESGRISSTRDSDVAAYVYYFSRDDIDIQSYRDFGNSWRGEDSNGRLREQSSRTKNALTFGSHNILSEVDSLYLAIYKRSRYPFANAAFLELRSSSNFRIKVNTSKNEVPMRFRLNLKGASNDRPLLFNTTGVDISFNIRVYTDSVTGARFIRPLSYQLASIGFSTRSGFSISDTNALEFINELLDVTDGDINLSMTNIVIDGQPVSSIDVLQEGFKKPVFLGGKRSENSLGYRNPPVTDSIKPIVPDEGRLGGTSLNELPWSSLVKEEEWRDNFIGGYFSVSRDRAGVLEKDQAKFVLVANPTFSELDDISSVEVFGVEGISDLVFSSPVNGDTPNGREDLTRVFSLSSSNTDDLETLVTSLLDGEEGRENFKFRCKDDSDSLISLDLIDYQTEEDRVIGYNIDNNINYLSTRTATGREKSILSAGGAIQGIANIPDVVAFGQKKVQDVAGVRYSYFILIRKGSSLSSETTLILDVGGTSTTLTKVPNSTLSEVEEFMEPTPTRTSLTQTTGSFSITITKGSDSTLFQFVSGQQGVRSSTVYADCVIFELGMISPVRDGTRRTIGGANFDKKEVEVRQIYSAYPDRYKSLAVFRDNMALFQDDRVYFLYNNENRANHLIRILNGTPADDIKELIIKSSYVPGLFPLGYPTVITDYLKSTQSALSSVFSSSVYTRTLEDYLNGQGLNNVVDYSKRALDPRGRKVSLNRGVSSFGGDGIIVSSDIGLFSVPAVQGRDPSLVHSQQSDFDLFVFNNKIVFITPDNLIATQVSSREREGLRTLFSGGDQVHLLRDIEGIIYDHKRQLYLMNNGSYDIICATDFDTQVGGFGTWRTEEVQGAKKFRFLKLLYSDQGVKALTRYRRLNQIDNVYEDALAVVLFSDALAFDDNVDSPFVSSITSNQLINNSLALDSGIYPGQVRYVSITFEGSRQIKVRQTADRMGFIEQEYILRDANGDVLVDVPGPIQIMSPKKGYNPRIVIQQSDPEDSEGVIYGFKMRGSIDGV